LAGSGLAFSLCGQSPSKPHRKVKERVRDNEEQSAGIQRRGGRACTREPAAVAIPGHNLRRCTVLGQSLPGVYDPALSLEFDGEFRISAGRTHG